MQEERRGEAISTPSKTGTSMRVFRLALALGAAWFLPGQGHLFAQSPDPPLRLALSSTVISGVNISDARAAMLVWLRQVSKEHNVSVEFVPEVFLSSEQIVQSIRQGLIDAVTLTTPEYPRVSDFLDPQRLLVDDYGGDTGEEYLILVPQDSPIHSVADLRGRNIVLLEHPGMCLAPAWLSTLLAPLGASQPEQFFASLKRESKLSNVILPVFFRKTDAGMVTRRGFESVCELNPQVAKQVRILASSPKLVTAFFAFSRKYHARNIDELQQVLLALSSTATGRQLLTLFHSRQLTIRSASCLDVSLDLLRRYNRIQAARVSAAAGTAGQTSREAK